MPLIAKRLQDQIDTGLNPIGVGNSGYKFAALVDERSIKQSVETRQFSRERQQRQLACQALTVADPVVLIDDLAVSGETLRAAIDEISGPVQQVGVGMLFDSKTTKKRIGIENLVSGITYTRRGGGRPPINSIDTLRLYPDRLDNLAERYFNGYETDFKEVVTRKELTQ